MQTTELWDYGIMESCSWEISSKVTVSVLALLYFSLTVILRRATAVDSSLLRNIAAHSAT